ncbi:hypothetical protein PC116_g27056 [Phytophthora cactorum]|uniref:START-like domain n=2 Tax=Phytophthora cactorum TaxID=29920 RepID=A0A329RIP8_9STRA|nr:hypothetical protein GQ600_23159 [Phytophthora cactorum]KAF1795725.1 hypothetical protein GQ600_10537 [Phytophthora cactorum]KAG2759119.1 hypothetical protein Pcac1_g28813 [Phytophthora cactorum]KAG2793224.1 hypothetical protein PC112_g23533 [Phytophthora cactorum]KAG2794704.1 hypothetical protein PC111_g22481 [Phytophthora cactorum]
MSEKRYKSAYFMRKQEKEDLKEEVRRLRSELTRLDPGPQVAAESAAIRTTIRQQQLGIANVQSEIPPLLQTHPLYSRICLKKSWEDRSATLLAFRDKKFKAAYEYVTVRSRMAQPQLSDERFETTNDNTCCVIFQTVDFPDVNSLQQVYDALLFSVHNAEISISERLGHVTVRDDYEGVDGNIFNARIVSTNDDGVATELNCIMMSQLFDGTEGASGGEPCGIVVLDSVDEDQLYPYVPSERIRKDVSGAFVLTVRQPARQRVESTQPASGGEGKVVTLRRAVFVKLYRPEFEISEAVWQNLQQETTRWGDVVIRSIRSVLYSIP